MGNFYQHTWMDTDKKGYDIEIAEGLASDNQEGEKLGAQSRES